MILLWLKRKQLLMEEGEVGGRRRERPANDHGGKDRDQQ